MNDVFQWKNRTLDAVTLYFYATLMRLAYHPQSPQWSYLIDNFPGVIQAAHVAPASPVASGWSVLYGETGTIVVFQGTRSAIQYGPQFIDANAYNFPVSEDPTFPGRVSIFGKTRLDELYSPNLFNAVSVGLGSGLTTCGHSLGGMIAQLAACRLRRDFLLTLQGVITCGSTKVGDDSFARDIGFGVHRVENTGDPVPLWPFNSNFNGIRLPDRWQLMNVQEYHHAGLQYLIDPASRMVISKGPFTAAGFSLEQRGVSGPHPIIIKPAAYWQPWWNHFPEEYCRRLRNRLFRDALWNRLQLEQRRVLDRINVDLNTAEGIDWKIDVPTGRLQDTIVNPNLPAPQCGCGH